MDNEEFNRVVEGQFGAAESALGQQMYQAQTDYYKAQTVGTMQHVALDKRKEALYGLAASAVSVVLLLTLALFIPVYVWLWKWALAA